MCVFVCVYPYLDGSTHLYLNNSTLHSIGFAWAVGAEHYAPVTGPGALLPGSSLLVCGRVLEKLSRKKCWVHSFSQLFYEPNNSSGDM